MYRQQRQTLNYMRLMEHEVPKLVGQSSLARTIECPLIHLLAFRKPFVHPTSTTPLVIRSVNFAGEQHPLTEKRSVVVPVVHLPLRNEIAIQRAKLLAGVRWTPDPPRDSGIPADENIAKHGFIKIACEDFPRANMNLKWISDTLDKLVREANVGVEFNRPRLLSIFIIARLMARPYMNGYHSIHDISMLKYGKRRRVIMFEAEVDYVQVSKISLRTGFQSVRRM
jgi:hypothetical protein